MNSKERVKATLKHKLLDKIAIFDFFDEITLINWKQQAHLANVEPVDYFDFDLDFRVENSSKDKFKPLSLNGPFQQLASDKGLQKALIDFTREPRHTKSFFKNSLDNIFSNYEKHKPAIDGIWLCEDIAYNNGLYFSVDTYKHQLFDFHNEISLYFKDKGIPVIFHCDGDVEKLIPFLIKANFSGIHPLQESCNPNIMRIKKDTGSAITFIGAIGLGRIMGLHDDIFDRISELKHDGNYIFCFDGPLPQDTEFKMYEDLITKIENVGAYQ